jgi:formiminoglutamase
MSEETPWLDIQRGSAPLVVSLPHTGTRIPEAIEARLASSWLARKDADWWVERLYDFAGQLGASVVRTEISRTVIDVNRDPSGASLYPGQATTGLCPLTSFDGEPLYRVHQAPTGEEIAERRGRWFDPYHVALAAEIDRVKDQHGVAVLYDAHSIRSRIPRLFDGDLPDLNIGANDGRSCDGALAAAVEAACARTAFTHVLNGRFKGGWTTRHYGRPAENVHAIQMELACRAYMDEPAEPDAQTWPTPYDAARAAPMRAALADILQACIAFARSRP